MRRPRLLRPRLRLWSLAALGSTAFANRRDLARWGRFLKRAAGERSRRPISDVLTEAKVRLAVSSDPMLRRDPSLDDLRVDDGVVTLHTSTAGWPDPRDQIFRLKKVKGITDVRSEMSSPAGSNQGVVPPSETDLLERRAV
jgi:hypothetical protein